MKYLLLFITMVLFITLLFAQSTDFPLPLRNPQHLKQTATSAPFDAANQQVTPLPLRNPNRTKKADRKKQNIKKPDIKKPDSWSLEQITTAKAACSTLFSKITVEFEYIEPFKKGICGHPAPIRLISLGEAPKVKILPPAKVNCKVAYDLAQWLKQDVQALAQSTLNTKITGLRNIASYACRRRYSNPSKKMSEHAFANAIDIAAFFTDDKRTISLVRDWGPTQRETLGALLQRQFATALATKIAGQLKLLEAASKQPPLQKQNQNQRVTKQASRAEWKTSLNPAKETEHSNTAIPSPTRKPASTFPLKSPQSTNDIRNPAKTLPNEAIFLRKVHEKACGIFGTVLGPEANDAHKNHFHFDSIQRKYGPYCE